GIRCVYHGWKFDVQGNCVDMPNVPGHQDFKHKVRAKAYPCVERAGVVWVYLDPRGIAGAQPPPLPGFEILDQPEDQINVSFVHRHCNYLQALEGEIDTSHFGFLHAGHVNPADLAEDEPVLHNVVDRAPQYEVSDAPWGTRYAGYRPAGPGQTYWRFANFLFPFWTQAPNGEFHSHMHARAWVPLDDHNTMFVFLWWKHAVAANSLPQPTYRDGSPIGGTSRGNRYRPNTSDWLGRWRLADDESNDWGLDRDAQQRGHSYTGIDGIHLQDQAVTESMGPIIDFEFEHLAPSDRMITRTRRRLLRAARALEERGEPPPGSVDTDVYKDARSGYLLTRDQGDWQDVYDGQLARAVHPPAAVGAEAD
ncbi:MAG: (2Fe-2S)-binding protein, partial [Gammaproteobacteria bacterium]|nr:(2Fe-2S)-binding protein [Gammaproteobacteria bacterium]